MSLSCGRIPPFALWLPIFTLQICYLTLPVLLPLPTRSLMELLILCWPRNLYVFFVLCCPELGCHSLPSSEANPFRRGGASWAFNNGVPGELIQVMGDWKSDAYKVYLEFSLSSKVAIAERLIHNLPSS